MKRLGFGALVVVMLAACGPRRLDTGPTVPTLVQVGGARRPVQTLTDLDTVRDVAASKTHVFVATDRGVLVYGSGKEPEPTRLTTQDGLASDDVTAVAVRPGGEAWAATPEGLAAIIVGPDGVSARSAGAQAPPVGPVTDLLAQEQAGTWACGLRGLARYQEGSWTKFGEPGRCTRLVATEQGSLWVGTTSGAWQVQGDVIREHDAGRAMPAGHVRDLAPLGDGQVLALVHGEQGSMLAHYDGKRWFGYTVAELDRELVGLAVRGPDVLLLTPGYVFAIAREETEAEGVPLTMLRRMPRYAVRSYRARKTPAESVGPAGELPSRSEVLQAPRRPVEVPVEHEEPEPSRFVVRPVSASGEQVYLARHHDGTVYLADRNRGVLESRPGGEVRNLRSRDLVARQDLQLASDKQRQPWLVSDHGDVARWREDGGFERAPVPSGVRADSIARGPDGLVYVAGRVRGQDTAARVLKVGSQGLESTVERTLQLPTKLEGVPLLGVGPSSRFWLGLRVGREGGDGARMRGLAVFGPKDEEVTYHYRSDASSSGEKSEQTDGDSQPPAPTYRIPENLSSIEFDDDGYAWLASLNGVIRIGNDQAVTFGESRGVRGEVVSDVAVGPDRVWVAAAEGLGYYQGGDFEFTLPGLPDGAKPTALEVDGQGNLWTAGPKGALYYDGNRWQRLGRAQGLPTQELVDVEVDEQGWVWFLARDRVLLFRDGM